MNALEVENVSKSFGSLVAVRDVSLKVAAGELRAIIGPNGAGKTTFFNLISGFFPPTAGSIRFDGKDVTTVPAHKRVALGMGRTFQITEIFPELTVAENVRISVEVAAGYRLRPGSAAPRTRRCATASTRSWRSPGSRRAAAGLPASLPMAISAPPRSP